jgi:hypothetical protein
VVGLQRSLAHRLAPSVIVLPPVRRRVDKSGLALISPPMSAPLFKREVSVRPQCCWTLWNRRHGLSCQCVYKPCYGCGGGRQGPLTVPSGGGEVRVASFARSRGELLGGVPYHGL